jgi:hypothetical protein
VDTEKIRWRNERDDAHAEVCAKETKNEIKTLLTRPTSLEMSINPLTTSYLMLRRIEQIASGNVCSMLSSRQSGETPISRARVGQCLGWGIREPDRMNDA